MSCNTLGLTYFHEPRWETQLKLKSFNDHLAPPYEYGVNQIDKVLDAVNNYDRAAIGLLSLEYDLLGVSESMFKLYCPSYETRLDLIAYDLAWIIYLKNHNTPNIDDFRNFVKFEDRGRELFKIARKLAVSKLQVDISYRELTKKPKTWYNRSMILRLVFGIIIAWAVVTLLLLALYVGFPMTCGFMSEWAKTHDTQVPQICQDFLNH